MPVSVLVRLEVAPAGPGGPDPSTASAISAVTMVPVRRNVFWLDTVALHRLISARAPKTRRVRVAPHSHSVAIHRPGLLHWSAPRLVAQLQPLRVEQQS